MHPAGARAFYRSIRGSLGVAAALLALDVALFGTAMASLIPCPLWIVVSLLRSAIHRPGWGLALVRVAIPALTLGIVLGNDAFQRGVADANARRVVAACEAYHAAHGDFPRKLDELVPEFLDSVPPAKYCLGPPSLFFYAYNQGRPAFFWQVVPPHGRRTYDFESRRWGHLD